MQEVLDQSLVAIAGAREAKLPAHPRCIGLLIEAIDGLEDLFAAAMALSSSLAKNGSSVSASRAKFHLMMPGWFEKAYRPNWSIELNTLSGW